MASYSPLLDRRGYPAFNLLIDRVKDYFEWHSEFTVAVHALILAGDKDEHFYYPFLGYPEIRIALQDYLTERKVVLTSIILARKLASDMETGSVSSPGLVFHNLRVTLQVMRHIRNIQYYLYEDWHEEYLYDTLQSKGYTLEVTSLSNFEYQFKARKNAGTHARFRGETEIGGTVLKYTPRQQWQLELTQGGCTYRSWINRLVMIWSNPVFFSFTALQMKSSVIRRFRMLNEAFPLVKAKRRTYILKDRYWILKDPEDVVVHPPGFFDRHYVHDANAGRMQGTDIDSVPYEYTAHFVEPKEQNLEPFMGEQIVVDVPDGSDTDTSSIDMSYFQ